jgi:hypothetical protein
MPRCPRGEKHSADVIGAPVMGARIATGKIEDVTDKTPNRAKGGKVEKNELKSSQRPNEVLLLVTQPFAAGQSATRFFSRRTTSRSGLTVYDTGVHNCSRNRARNWVHSRIWRSRDYFLSTASTRRAAIVPFLRLASRAPDTVPRGRAACREAMA